MKEKGKEASMARVKISEEEYKAIKAKWEAEVDKKAANRLHILMLRYEGVSNNKIAEMFNMSPTTTSKMYKRYREQGLEEFCRKKYTSQHQKLSYEGEGAILEKFRNEADAGKVVKAADIKRAFDEIRGKDTGRGYIYMLLKRHGWRKVMPRPRHPKAADEEACEASKKLSNL